MKQRFLVQGEPHAVELSALGTGYAARIEGETYDVADVEIGENEIRFVFGTLRHRASLVKKGRELWVHIGGKSYHFVKAAASQAGVAAASTERILRAPMPGQVRKVFVRESDAVEPGDVLLLLEAMKMEIRIHAPLAAQVARVAVKQGQSVEKEQVLVELENE